MAEVYRLALTDSKLKYCPRCGSELEVSGSFDCECGKDQIRFDLKCVNSKCSMDTYVTILRSLDNTTDFAAFRKAVNG